MTIRKAKSFKYLMSPHKGGIGISYEDERFPGKYDLGIASTSRGRYVISWGLNLAENEIPEGVDAVFVGRVWVGDDKPLRDNYEIIIERIRK